MNRKNLAALKFAGLATTAMVLTFAPGGLLDDHKTSVDRPDVKNSTVLINKLTTAGYYCWTGDQENPDNYTATTVVVARDSKAPFIGATSQWVDRAVEQTVFGVDHDLTVYAFCGLRP